MIDESHKSVVLDGSTLAVGVQERQHIFKPDEKETSPMKIQKVPSSPNFGLNGKTREKLEYFT